MGNCCPGGDFKSSIGSDKGNSSSRRSRDVVRESARNPNSSESRIAYDDYIREMGDHASLYEQTIKRTNRIEDKRIRESPEIQDFIESYSKLIDSMRDEGKLENEILEATKALQIEYEQKHPRSTFLPSRSSDSESE